MDNITTNNNKEPIFNLKYRITEDEYIYYNQLYANESFRSKKKKANFTGTLELCTGLAIILFVFFADFANKHLVALLAAILIGFGTYSLMFYRVFFPRSLKKSASGYYNRSSYLKGEINLSFYNNRLEEKGEGSENTYKWSEVESFAKSEKLYFITLKGQRSILISKTSLGDEKFMLEEFFETISKKYGKIYKEWKE